MEMDTLVEQNDDAEYSEASQCGAHIPLLRESRGPSRNKFWTNFVSRKYPHKHLSLTRRDSKRMFLKLGDDGDMQCEDISSSLSGPASPLMLVDSNGLDRDISVLSMSIASRNKVKNTRRFRSSLSRILSRKRMSGGGKNASYDHDDVHNNFDAFAEMVPQEAELAPTETSDGGAVVPQFILFKSNEDDISVISMAPFQDRIQQGKAPCVHTSSKIKRMYALADERTKYATTNHRRDVLARKKAQVAISKSTNTPTTLKGRLSPFEEGGEKTTTISSSRIGRILSAYCCVYFSIAVLNYYFLWGNSGISLAPPIFIPLAHVLEYLLASDLNLGIKRSRKHPTNHH